MFERGALDLATEIDLDGVQTCPLCLWELAQEFRHGRQPSRALVARTADWIWAESEDGIREAVKQARMQERPFAEEALRELEVNGWRGGFVEAVVCRLARRLADELSA